MRCSPAARICRARLSGSPSWARSCCCRARLRPRWPHSWGGTAYERAASSGGPASWDAQRVLPDHGQDHRGAGDAGPTQAARHTERFASQLFGTHVTKTNALESLVIAGFVRGLSTRDVEAALVEALGEQAAVSKSTVSRICGEIEDPVRSVERPPPRRRRAGLPVFGRQPLQISRQRLGGTGAGRVGHRHRRQTGVCRAGGRVVGVRGRLGGLFDRARRARAGLPATGDQRRRGRADRRRRAHHGRGVAAMLPDPSRQKRLGQGAEKCSGRGEGRLLGDLRPARGCPARPGRGGQGSSRRSTRSPQLARLVSGGGALPARRPRLADRLPAPASSGRRSSS